MLAAEALLAVSGVFPDALTRAHGQEAEALPREWASAVRDWLDADRPRKFKLGASPPKTAYDMLTAGIPQDQAAALVDDLASPELQTAYLAALSNAREYLRSHWPALSQETPTGPRMLEVGWVQRSEIRALWQVAERPERILADMQAGTLTAAQVDCFIACYPGLAEMLRSLLSQELTKRAAKLKSYQVPWRQERVLRILLQLPPDVAIASVEQPEPAGSAAGGKLSVDFETRSQRIAAK